MCIDCRCDQNLSKNSSTDENGHSDSISFDGDECMSVQKPEKNENKVKRGDLDWNNFQVRRTCFRGMSSYFKSKFSKYNRIWQRARSNK